jgi:hypothetical protein
MLSFGSAPAWSSSSKSMSAEGSTSAEKSSTSVVDKVVGARSGIVALLIMLKVKTVRVRDRVVVKVLSLQRLTKYKFVNAVFNSSAMELFPKTG